MSAIETIERILDTSLVFEELKYCLINDKKFPFKIDNSIASVKNYDDFVSLETLLECKKLKDYSGVGISVQASNICAIDIDNCVKEPFDKNTINDFSLEIINMFKDFAYIEFSFSGTGIRILFKQKSIDEYSSNYKIKNSEIGVEYYQPNHSNRYVSVTGRYLYNNSISSNIDYFDIILEFLEKYMKKKRITRNNKKIKETVDNRSIEEIMKKVKYHYLTCFDFQDLWFKHAPGSGKDESERDYRLVRYLYENITQDGDRVKEIFELSDFYKTKDKKHLYKWTRDDFRYFNYIFNDIKEKYE